MFWFKIFTNSKSKNGWPFTGLEEKKHLQHIKYLTVLELFDKFFLLILLT